jgi:serine/threonine protein phosphatase PrpC
MNNSAAEARAPRVESASLSNIGRKRKNNEDFVASFEPTDPKEQQESGCLYVVADGVGGAARGERASEYAAGQVLYEYFQHPEIEPGERLRHVMARVNSEINAFAENNNTRMATTLVAAVVRDAFLTVANVGDSRAYLIRGGETQQITQDHSLVGELLRSGSLTEKEAQQSKVKNTLSRSLGGDQSVTVDIFRDIPLLPGDMIVLCTDGLTRYALREDISQITSQGSPKEIAAELVSFANRSGGGDNITVIVIAFDPVGGSATSPLIQQPLREPAGWQDMLTEQPVVGVQTPRRRDRSKRRIIPYVILGLALLLVAGVVALFTIFPPWPATPAQTNPTTGAGLTGTPSVETGLTETAATGLPLINGSPATFTPLPVTLSNEFPTQTETPTFTQTPIPTETPTITQTLPTSSSLPPVNPVLFSCQWKVTLGTSLWGLATSWAGILPSNEPGLIAFYDTVKCAPQPNGNCDYQPPSRLIIPGWILILPQIPSNICILKGGTPIPPPS